MLSFENKFGISLLGLQEIQEKGYASGDVPRERVKYIFCFSCGHSLFSYNIYIYIKKLIGQNQKRQVSYLFFLKGVRLYGTRMWAVILFVN